MPPGTMAPTSNPTELQAQKLLDFNEKLDIGLLDKVVSSLYSSVGEEQKAAQQVAKKICLLEIIKSVDNFR